MSELELQTTNNDLSPIDRPGVGGTAFSITLTENLFPVTTYEAIRMGNTTRIIDSVIQLLFITNTIILVKDHYWEISTISKYTIIPITV